MAPTKTITALLALLVVATGAAAAMPGSAPADTAQADDRANEEDAAAQADGANGSAEATADGESVEEERNGSAGPPEQAAGERGPPADMPAPVPDFVSDIHQTIQDYLNGAVDDLGAAISDITPDDADGADESSGDSETSGEESADSAGGESADSEMSDEEPTDGETADGGSDQQSTETPA